MSWTAYQEDDRDVEQESYYGIGDQYERANFVDVAHVHDGHLNDKGCDAVHDGTDGCEVIQ
jgi:hypothetical protein